VVATIVRVILNRTTIDNKIGKAVFVADSSRTISIEDVVSRDVFYLLMLLGLDCVFRGVAVA
jgi:hypothetical protein